MYAAEAGHARLVRDLVVCHKAVVSLRDDSGDDAFVAACSGGHVHIAAFLLGRPCLHEGELLDRDLDEINNQGLTALYVSAIRGQVDIVAYLIDQGASTEGIEPDKIGRMIDADAMDSSSRINSIRRLLGFAPLEPECSVTTPQTSPRRGSLSLRRYITI
jgi:hypothetical protein